jgi:hypothetical protein
MAKIIDRTSLTALLVMAMDQDCFWKVKVFSVQTLIYCLLPHALSFHFRLPMLPQTTVQQVHYHQNLCLE